mgnify:CR=1 FL=1
MPKKKALPRGNYDGVEAILTIAGPTVATSVVAKPSTIELIVREVITEPEKRKPHSRNLVSR